MDELVYWIWLSLAVTPGSVTFSKLIGELDTPEAIYNAEDDELSHIIGSRSSDLSALKEKDLERAREIYDLCKRKSIGIITYCDPQFPKALTEIPTPPVLLYYRGILPDFNSSCTVAMVGTRRLTDYGRRNAFAIGYDLACAGAIVASGMAIGIDGVSHAGSLAAGGVNVAFLGSGIDICYPEQHKRLAREIVKSGCVMTEYAPGTRPERYNFPKRNRLIAAISCATVVIEGRENSGSIITARYAKEFGKRLYALPGNVDNKTSEVTNLLIKTGAQLITAADDIVSDLEFIYTGIINPFNLKKRPEVDMNEIFSELQISCVSAGDGIFSPPRRKRVKKAAELTEEVVTLEEAARRTSDAELSLKDMNFDEATIRIYKKIPADADCTVDSLSDDTDKMPIVMKALLKLEMGRFITMLPGEKVKRNIN
ncbi:MAG: DNA-protecting protein DprA [Ruminococcaceae bacterium]|nr:DNA-protecting protein DprA [Oscillospiraceae bacterium]